MVWPFSVRAGLCFNPLSGEAGKLPAFFRKPLSEESLTEGVSHNLSGKEKEIPANLVVSGISPE